MSGQFDPRITAYFGDAVLQAGFMPLPHLFLRRYRTLGLSQVQAMFVLQVMEIAWDVSDPPNTIAKIASRMGLSHRSVRACSKEVHDLGLVEIYDQWDDAGAQVENAYDLGPLFRRLAELVPPQIPAGQQRMRRQRDAHTSDEAPEENTSYSHSPERLDIATPPLQKPSHSPLQETSPSPLKNSARGGVQETSSPPLQKPATPPGTNVQGATDHMIRGPLQKRSGLKENTKKTNKKPLRNQQEHHGGGVQPLMPGLEPEQAGWSLRWNVALSAEDVARSQAILDRAGLHTLVAQRSAPTLAPAECWSLVCYARGATLGPAWIATQVYDWNTRTPQLSTLNQRYDEVGRALAAIGDEQAGTLINITNEWCLQGSEQWESAVEDFCMTLANDDHSAVMEAAKAVWNVMAEQRHAPSSRTPAQRIAPPPPAPCGYDEQWSSVCHSLRADMLTGDWRSWIEPLALLDIEHDIAIVGAPNVFVRNEVEARYASTLQDALRSAFGRDLQLELVIGTAVMS